MTPRQINAERIAGGLPPLNFKLFRKVIKKLETAPLAYSQKDVIKPSDTAPCGTAACIGGWAHLLDGHRNRRNKDRVLTSAAAILGLNDKGSHWRDGQAETVFSGDPDYEWPQPYRNQWREAKTVRGQARVAIRYLKHIINTGRVTE
jgi:hypothetical protein